MYSFVPIGNVCNQQSAWINTGAEEFKGDRITYIQAMEEREGKRVKLDNNDAEDEEWQRFQAEIEEVEHSNRNKNSHVIEAAAQINEEPTQDEERPEEDDEEEVEKRVVDDLELQKELHTRVGELKSKVQNWKGTRREAEEVIEKEQQQYDAEDSDDGEDSDSDDVFKIKKK